MNTSDKETNQHEQSGEMVQISSRKVSRRSFLKIAGAATAAGAVGCANDPGQKILPYVKPDPEQIPGVAQWFSSTCTECSAGCGIRVRTREGRAVKVEGNPDSPVNRGGLCGLGQSALQSLYDPDRIRQPLMKKRTTPQGPEFAPVSWDEAFSTVGSALSAATNEKLFITGSLISSYDSLVSEFSQAGRFERVTYEPLEPVAVAKASEIVFGVSGTPTFNIEQAEVILNFGADFLETWVSPCNFARQWSNSRRSKKPLRLVHVEPRLSLTGANADLWLNANPGSEVRIVLSLIRDLLARGRGKNLSEDVRSHLSQISKDVSFEKAAEETGVSREKLTLIADYLDEADSSLVIAGGAATATSDPLPLLVAVNFLNMLLENVGRTVGVYESKQSRSSIPQFAAAIDRMRAGKVDVVFIHGTNPAFNLPPSYGFKYALNNVSIKGSDTKKAGLVVAFASHLDETAQLADLILPTNTGLEDWGLSVPQAGVVSLAQPVMSPIFDTKSFGDALFTIASGAKISLPSGDISDTQAYVKNRYKQLAGSKAGKDYDDFWRRSLELGGTFEEAPPVASLRVSVDPAAYKLSFEANHLTKSGELLVFPYPSVTSFDGRAANRPWLQELPDPITQVVWDSWGEIHPETAKKFSLANGDLMILRTADGEINVPVFVTEHVHRDIVAVPMGQGHTAYGRYASSVGRGNVFSLLPKTQTVGTDALPLLSASLVPERGIGDAKLISVQGSDSQVGRELARTKFIGGASEHEEHGEEHADHEKAKQMYEQRQHPLYQWGMTIDLAACTGCSACVVACYAENNIPVVGKTIVGQGREMSWLRIERYYDTVEGENGAEELKVSFLPMLCQHCQNAPCEPVCPVYATYHNEEGLNAMVYNRCVGTRYCSNNCSYKVRRFNWFQYEWPELLDWQLNPDVTKRTVGVMEKCTFCVQRIAEAKDNAKDLGRMVEDGEIKPACVQTCPTQALTFGNLKDPNSKVSLAAKGERSYKVLDHHLNTQPSITYLEDIRYKA